MVKKIILTICQYVWICTLFDITFVKKKTMNDTMDDDDKVVNRKKGSDSGTPVLDNFSRDLNKLAEQGKLDPVIGREPEIERLAQIISRRRSTTILEF